MTAIVAVLNKHAVAIAADSAVTMGDTHKVVIVPTRYSRSQSIIQSLL